MKYVYIIALLLLGSLTVSYVTYALSGVITSTPTNYALPITLLNATTTNATSTPVPIRGARSVTFFFDRKGPQGSGVGTSTFSVDVSLGTTTFVTYNKLISNTANTNSQTLTRVASVALTGTTTATYTMDLQGESYNTLRCIVVEGTDGTHTCDAFIQY